MLPPPTSLLFSSAVGASVLPPLASTAVDTSMPPLTPKAVLASAADSATALARSLLPSLSRCRPVAPTTGLCSQLLALGAPLLPPPASFCFSSAVVASGLPSASSAVDASLPSLAPEAALASAATSATALARSLIPTSALGAPWLLLSISLLFSSAVGASLLPPSASSAVDA